MHFQLVDSGWDQVLNDALSLKSTTVRIICPFIKKGIAERLLTTAVGGSMQVITRFNLDDFFAGVSDTSALRLLVQNGAEVRGVCNLHAKVYLFGKERVVVTSANLTDRALRRNHEFGFVADDSMIVRRCTEYFESLWAIAGKNLETPRIDAWDAKLQQRRAQGGASTQKAGLGDDGVDVGISAEPLASPIRIADAPQSFVKFFGEGHKRVVPSTTVLEEVKRSGCHWACTYPKNKRPRQVRDGAVIFMGRLVHGPDIFVFGRAVGMQYVDERDNATAADIARRDWKKNFPHYVRVHHPEFVAGALSNGVSFNTLKATLKSHAFRSTLRNLTKGEGNTDPNRAYRQQAAVELTAMGSTWLNEQLNAAFLRHGRIPNDTIDRLDKPAAF